jgi:hypothetical protein
MNIWYFFMANVQKQGHIVIMYCLTNVMIGDFFTKPLGRNKFHRFPNIIMNCDHDDYGLVDMDEVMNDHYRRMGDDRDADDDEPTVSRTSETVGSHECVESRSNHI